MNRKLFVAVFCVITVFVVGSLSITFGSRDSSALSAKGQTNPPPPPTATTIPDHILYDRFFDHVAMFKKLAKEADEKGEREKAAKLRGAVKRLANLNDTEADLLNQAATVYKQKIEAQDAKAKKIIDAVLAKHNGGRLQPGEALPPPSPELVVLQEERNQMTLTARDTLRGAFGEAAFVALDKYARNTLGPHLKVVRIDGLPTDMARPKRPGALRRLELQPKPQQ